MKLLNHESLKAKGITYSRVQLWRLVRAGKFPAPIKVGENRNAWVESEIDTWIEKRIAERDSKVEAA
jgi:prophage regulatory protein